MKSLILLFLLTVSSLANDYKEYDAEVLQVHDGDTATVRIFLGFDISYIAQLRLLEVFAPEISSKDGPKCRDHLKEIIGDKVTVKIYKTKNGTDLKSFNRYISSITNGDIDVNIEMKNWLEKNKLTGGIGKK